MNSLSIIIPAHNEKDRIEPTLIEYAKFYPKAEIIVVINGSTDNTEEIVKKIEKNFKNIKHITIKEKIGKGGAVVEGFKLAKNDLIGFADADNATTPKEFNKLVKYLKDNLILEGCFASRKHKYSKITSKQPVLRRLAGHVFNQLTRILFGLNYTDTQCGAKLFKRRNLQKLSQKMKVTDWAFDVNLLYLYKINKLQVAEYPIVWKDIEKSKVNLLRTSTRMFLSLIRLRLIYSPIGNNTYLRKIARVIYKKLIRWI